MSEHGIREESSECGQTNFFPVLCANQPPMLRIFQQFPCQDVGVIAATFRSVESCFLCTFPTLGPDTIKLTFMAYTQPVSRVGPRIEDRNVDLFNGGGRGL